MSRQKRKGDGYERELAKWLDAMLFDSKNQIQRMPLSGGGSHVGGGGRADITGTPTIWVEAKRTEKFAPYAAMEQAEMGIKNSNSGEMPVVMQRRNRMATEDSLVVMRLNDWICLYASWLKEIGYEIYDPSDGVTVIVEFDEDVAKRLDREDDRSGKVVPLFPLNKEKPDGQS